MSSITGRTILVHGGSITSRKAFIDNLLDSGSNGSSSTIHLLDAYVKTPSVEQVREFIRLSEYSSLASSQVTIYMILGAENLSPLIQNVLLKTLEEVSENKSFVLETGSIDVLLPTIQSRAYPIMLEEEGSGDTLDVASLSDKPLHELFSLAEEYAAEDNKARLLMKSLLRFMRERYLQQGIILAHLNYTEFLLANYEVIGRTNASVRLILENCLLNFYSLFGKK